MGPPGSPVHRFSGRRTKWGMHFARQQVRGALYSLAAHLHLRSLWLKSSTSFAISTRRWSYWFQSAQIPFLKTYNCAYTDLAHHLALLDYQASVLRFWRLGWVSQRV